MGYEYKWFKWYILILVMVEVSLQDPVASNFDGKQGRNLS